MKKKLAAAALIFLMCILAAVPALAADVFRFAEDAVQVYAGESITPELIRDGKFADGTVTYSLNKTIAEVDENGTLTGINLGQLYLTAVLEQDGRQVKNAHTLVTVCRKVTKVTLNTNGLQVFEPDDERILPLLKPEEGSEPVADQVLVLDHGRIAQLGSPEELKKVPGLYREIDRIQSVSVEAADKGKEVKGA